MDIIKVTNSASSEIKRLLTLENSSEEMGLRLSIKGGGCSGLSYVTKLDIQQELDIIQEEDGFKIFIDRTSSLYLKDTELDFKTDLSDMGFKFNNPLATNTCGCGSSFMI